MITLNLVVQTKIDPSLQDVATGTAVNNLAAVLYQAICDQLPFDKAEASVVLMDDEDVRVLNRDYRGKDKPTNVLSFANYTAQELSTLKLPEGMPLELGDIMIALPTVLREAKAQEKLPAHHFLHLCLHGICHLLGYDHNNDINADIMESLEIQVLAQLDIPDPYNDRD